MEYFINSYWMRRSGSQFKINQSYRTKSILIWSTKAACHLKIKSLIWRDTVANTWNPIDRNQITPLSDPWPQTLLFYLLLTSRIILKTEICSCQALVWKLLIVFQCANIFLTYKRKLIFGPLFFSPSSLYPKLHSNL